MHISIIFDEANWYRFFGAGEGMAKLAESVSAYPSIVTSVISLVLFLFGLYAFSGAGLIVKLPLLKTVLCFITFIYLLRGVIGFILPFISNHPAITQNTLSFWLVSSLICVTLGLFYLFGMMSRWRQL